MVFHLTSERDERAKTASFAELALPLFDSLYNFAHWLAQDRTEAEDLVQETYAKALRAFASFEQGTNFRAWMFRILRNTFLNSRTALAAVHTAAWGGDEDASALPLDPETPESIFLEHADRQTIQEAIEKLPVAFREVLLLSDVEEMSYREIAEALAIPIGTVMSRLARARSELRKSLQGKLARA